MKVAVSFLIIFLALSSIAFSNGPSDLPEKFMIQLVANKSIEAVEEYFSTNLLLSQNGQQIKILREQIEVAFSIYGKPASYELAIEDDLAPSLKRYVFISKHDHHVLNWEFYVYKPKDAWTGSNMTFNDDFSLLESKKYAAKPGCETNSDFTRGKVRCSGSSATIDGPDGGGIKLSVATEVINAAWGTGADQLGRSEPEEASPEAPMSFAVSDDGSIYILDQLNQRIQVFNAAGNRIDTIVISGPTYSDIDLGQAGRIVLLDQCRNEAVVFIDGTGRMVGRVALLGGEVHDIGGVNGIWSRIDGVWVGYESTLVRVCDANGKADPDRPAVSGRFSRDGRYLLSTVKVGDITASLTRKRVGEDKVENFSVFFDLPILYFTLIDTDAGGKIYLGVTLLAEGVDPPYNLEQSREEVVVFGSTGSELKRLIMPVSTDAGGVTRSLRLAADGTVYQLVIGESSATVRRYDP